MVRDTIFGSQEAQKKDMFGEYTSEAEKELSRFKKEEDFLQALQGSLSQLKESIRAMIAS